MTDSTPRRPRLKWARVMAGEYKSEAPNGWIYYVDTFYDHCSRSTCNHSHEGWVLTAAPAGLTSKLGEFPTLRTAKAAAELHASQTGCDA